MAIEKPTTPDPPVLSCPGEAAKPLRDTSVKPTQRRLLVPLAVVLLLLIGGFSAVLLHLQHETLTRFSQQMLLDASDELDESLAEQSEMLHALEDPLIRDAGLIDALKAQDRDRLFTLCEDLFAEVRQDHGITHFYFHGPDRVNLLRVHKRERHGDLINRFTARQAEQTGKTASGIELGPLGTFTLRLVQPVFDGEVLIGYLELGKEIEDILVDISEKHAVELTAVIHKSELHRETWEAGMKMLGHEAFWDDHDEKVVIYSSLGHLPDPIGDVVDEVGHTHGDATVDVTFDDRSWRFLASPLFDASGAEVGDLLIFHDTTEAKAQFYRSLLLSSGAALGLMVVLIGFLYLALHRIDRDIIDKEAELRDNSDKLCETLKRERLASSELESAMHQLKITATTDKLTGMSNMAVFEDRLEQEIQRSDRDGNRFAVLFFNFDRFKVINDGLGHSVGDALLVDIARQFQQVVKQGNEAARFGGDEFVVLLKNLPDYPEAEQAANRLLDLFAKPHHIMGHEVTSTASIGLVTNEKGYATAQEMIRDAGAATYQAKLAGKARIVTFDKAMHDKALDRLTLERDLRSVLSGEQFRLYYQPIIELSTGELSGFEALIRWKHPERDLVSPADFIPITEDTGLIVEIGRWVLHTASRQIAEWNRKLGPDSQLFMNVNVSKRQLLSPTFMDDVIECQREYGLHPKELKLEITESIIADSQADVVPLLCRLRDHGFPIALDDFGTGVSSLSTLHDYPIDVLKIDQSFIRVLDRDRSLLAVVASITSLAENLGILTVAEGIETSDIVGALQSIDCTWGQGYHFAKPQTTEDAEAYNIDKAEHKRSA